MSSPMAGGVCGSAPRETSSTSKNVSASKAAGCLRMCVIAARRRVLSSYALGCLGDPGACIPLIMST